MKRVPNLIVLAAMMSLAIAAVSFAQPPAGNVALAYVQTVDLQKAAAFEEGFKKHLAWRKAQGDTWRWDTWQMVRGEKLGSYYTVSDGHAWKDFDAQPLGPRQMKTTWPAWAMRFYESMEACPSPSRSSVASRLKS